MSEVLSSWKDIAAHLGKSVRTVQRWEIELGLPIHRPNQRQQRIILAYPDELKRWAGVRRAPQRSSGEQATAELEKNKSLLMSRVQKLHSLTVSLSERTAATLDRAQRTRSLARKAAAQS